ncbi:MAG: ECF transporter S component [Christensenellales bacterium]
MSKRLFSTQMMVRVALLAAVSFILFRFFEIPAIAFYKLDLSGVPVLLAGFAMGPLAGMMTLAVKDLLGLIGSSSGGLGELADFLMVGALVLSSSLIYLRHRSKKTVLWGMVVGTLLMTVMGALTNYYILIPLYEKFMPLDVIVSTAAAAVPFMGIDSVLEVVLYVTAPFNILKGLILSVVTYILYRYLGPVLKKGRL